MTRTIHSTEWTTDRTYYPRWTSQQKDYKKGVFDHKYCPEFIGLPGFTYSPHFYTPGGLHFTTSSSEAQESSDESDHDSQQDLKPPAKHPRPNEDNNDPPKTA